jgi:hypothetical protein
MERDFTPIALGMDQPYLLTVHRSLPVRSVEEFIKFVRARTGEVVYASASMGSAGHIAMDLIDQVRHRLEPRLPAQPRLERQPQGPGVFRGSFGDRPGPVEDERLHGSALIVEGRSHTDVDRGPHRAPIGQMGSPRVDPIAGDQAVGREVRRREAQRAAAAVPAATIFFYPGGFDTAAAALPVLALVIVPGLLMVSTIRFYSFKTVDLQSRRAYPVLALLALGLALMVAHEIMLVVISYAYLASGIVMWAWQRLRRHSHEEQQADLTTKVTKTN